MHLHLNLFLLALVYSTGCAARLSGYVDAVANSTLLPTVQAQDYDFVIVGGGTTGLALAARLSEQSNATVIVIEAGTSARDDPSVVIPALAGTNFMTRLDWNFTTVPQPAANNRSVYWPRGRALGGSSAINLLAVTRGYWADYDAWAALSGSSRWTFSRLLPYFQRSEFFHPPGNNTLNVEVAFEPAAHGNNGPIDVSYPPYLSPQFEGFFEGLQELGVPVDKDQSDGVKQGVSWNPSSMTEKRYHRETSDTGYILGVISRRPSLLVLSSAYATKIEWSSTATQSDGIVASGVRILADGHSLVLRASKEVILSAGSINTPQLLELSGVGNASILAPLGVDSVIDLPGVGENLQDHPAVILVYKLKPGYESLDNLTGERLAAALAEYATGAGTLTQQISTLAYATTDRYMSVADAIQSSLLAIKPNVHLSATQQVQQIKQLAAGSPSIEFLPINLNFGTTPTEPTASYVTFGACLQHSFSRGTIHIVSSDASVPPAIDPRYLDNPYDIFHLSRAAQYLRKVSNTVAMSHFIEREVEPGPTIETDPEWDEYVRSNVRTEFHPIGTASSMPRDQGGVVDSELRVYGTSNVRVADLSVLPIHLATHPQTVAYAIAERAAGLILGA